jgi:hypothetical protein
VKTYNFDIDLIIKFINEPNKNENIKYLQAVFGGFPMTVSHVRVVLCLLFREGKRSPEGFHHD